MLLVYFSNPCIFVVTVSQNSSVTLGDKMIVLNSSLWVSRHSFGLLQKYTKSMWGGESREHMSTTFLVSRALHLHRVQPSWCQHRVCTTCLTRGKIKSDWFVIWFKWSTEDKLTRDVTPPESDCQAPVLPPALGWTLLFFRQCAAVTALSLPELRVKINKHIVCRNIAASLQRVTL